MEQGLTWDARLNAAQGIDVWGPHRVIRARATDQLLVVGHGTLTVVSDYGAAWAEVERRDSLLARMPEIEAARKRIRAEQAARKLAAQKAALEAQALIQIPEDFTPVPWPDEPNEAVCGVCLEGATAEIDDEWGPMCKECIDLAGFEFYDDNESDTQQEVA